MSSRFECTLADFFADPGLSETEVEAKMERHHRAVISTLSASTDLEHRLASAFLRSKEEPVVDDLVALLPARPEDPLLHWLLLDACARTPSHPSCTRGVTERRAIDVLGANGEAWAKIAYRRLADGDDEGALAALEQAASAAVVTTYAGPTVALLFRALASVDNSAALLRYGEAMGYVAAMPSPPLMDLHKSCRERSRDSLAWRRTCLAYGQRKEQKSLTLLHKMLGIGLQTAIYDAAGQSSLAAASRAREDQITESLMADGLWQQAEIHLAHDGSLVLDYLQELAVYGEFAANDFLAAEIERRAQNPGYDPCPSSPRM